MIRSALTHTDHSGNDITLIIKRFKTQGSEDSAKAEEENIFIISLSLTKEKFKT